VSDSVVYYIRRGDHIKIGRTVDFRSRMGKLRPDEVLAVEPGGHEVETARHRQFREHHIAGHPEGIEWFHRGDDLLAHIAELAATRDVPELPRWRARGDAEPQIWTEEEHHLVDVLAGLLWLQDHKHELVDELRRRGLSDGEIATRVGVGAPTVRRWARYSGPDLRKAKNAAAAVHEATLARWAKRPDPDRRRNRPRGEQGD